MVKSETCQDVKTLVWKSKTKTKTILHAKTNETWKQDFMTHQKGFLDFEIRSRVFETQNFLGASRHPDK